MQMNDCTVLNHAIYYRDESKPATFTPFSVILGSMIKEIHRCMFVAMASEEYPITLTQLIKVRYIMRSTFVGSAWSFVFLSPPQRPMTSDFEGFLYQILSITLFSYFNS